MEEGRRARAGLLPGEEEETDAWVRAVSGRRAYPFGFRSAGPWAGLMAGPNRSPAAPFSFLNSFSVFLIYSISFAYLFQINSDKFLNSSNIYCNVLTQ
jgi:hypothetical protein